jgi:hypothetical protein
VLFTYLLVVFSFSLAFFYLKGPEKRWKLEDYGWDYWGTRDARIYRDGLLMASDSL